MPSQPLRGTASGQEPEDFDGVCSCRLKNCRLCKLRGQPDLQRKNLQVMEIIRGLALKGGSTPEEAETQVKAFKFEDCELQERQKWRKLKDTAMSLLHLINNSPNGECSLCKLILQPTYCESEHRFTVLSILKWCGVVEWTREEGFNARVQTCGHSKRLHMMHLDEDIQEAELILTFTFENPRFTEADFDGLCKIE